MAREDQGPAVRSVVERAFSAGPTLGLGLCACSDPGLLARRAEEAGFAALWVPPHALAAAAEATRAIALVTSVDVCLSPDIDPALPDAAGLEGRLAYAIRFTDPPAALRLSSRACRRVGAAVMRKVQAVTKKADTPVVIQGSCHESLEWIAEQAQAWAYDRARLACVPTLLTEWRRVAGAKPFIQMLAEGPGLEDRVEAMLRDGVDHVVIMMSSDAGSPALWGLPRTLNCCYSHQ